MKSLKQVWRSEVRFAAFVLFAAVSIPASAASWWIRAGVSDWTSYDSYYNNDTLPAGEKSLPAAGDTVYLSGSKTADNVYHLAAPLT